MYKSTHTNTRTNLKELLVKFITICIIVAVGFCTSASTVYAKELSIPGGTGDSYVNDFAGIFTEEQKSELENNAISLANNYNGIEVVITTVKNYDGDDFNIFATEMYRQYGIGKNDMGVLILLSTETRDIRLEVGYAMEAYITDSIADSLIEDYAINYLRENNFAEGLIELQKGTIDKIISLVGNEPVYAQNASSQEILPETSNTSSTNTSSENNSFGIVLFVVGLVAIVIMSLIVLKYLNSKDEEHGNMKKELEKVQKEALEQKETFEMDRNSLCEKVYSLNSKVNSLTKELNSMKEEKRRISASHAVLLEKNTTLQDRYSRAKILHPELDDEIDAMIKEEIRQKDMNTAKITDNLISKVIDLPADRTIIPEIEKALSSYAHLTESQKAYVKSDVKKLNVLYQASLELKKEYDEECERKRQQKAAKDAFNEISSIICGITIARADDLQRLNDAKHIYLSLDSGSRSFFDNSILSKLNQLIDDAERDMRRIEDARRREEERRRREREEEERRRREREEEERRRREAERRRREEDERRRRSSSYSSGSRSRSGGFGGRSGGGGASRKF